MKLMALEEHVLPRDVASLIWTDAIAHSVVGLLVLREKLADIETHRLPAMAALHGRLASRTFDVLFVNAGVTNDHRSACR